MQIYYDENDTKKKYPFYKNLPIGFKIPELSDFYDKYNRLIL